jgi:curved DNA-binding protein CbpA
MVKADPTRNYYADLKITASASENEIRKAFRALALQYHPDRNPGREAEFVVKFQEIQAAHEILGDQTQRIKYDTERRKYRNLNVPTNTPNTPRSRPPPPPRNAYTTSTPSGSYYRAPPPKPSPQPQRPPPPQQYASYATGADRFTNKNFRPPPTAQRQDTRAKDAKADAEARANVFSAWQKMKQPRAEEPRPYNPGAQGHQANHADQQNNPNGTPFGRTQSTRMPSSRKGFDPGTPGGDEGQARSAYRNYARPAETPPLSTTPPHHAPPPMNGAQKNEAPYSEANRMRTPYSNVAGERTSMFEGLGRSSSVRNSPTNGQRLASSTDPGSYSDSGRRQQRNSYGGQSRMPFPHMYPDSSDEESESEPPSMGNKHRGPQHPPPPPPQSQNPPLPTPSWAQPGFATPPQTRQSNDTFGNMPNSFKSRSEESINMKFSPSDWHGKFEGSSDYFAPNAPKGAAARGRTSPTRGRSTQQTASDRDSQGTSAMGPPPSPFTQPQGQFPSYPIPPPPPGPPPNLNFPPSDAAAQAAKFKPEEWADTFKEPSWVFTEQKETSPRRASETTKRPKAARKTSVAQDKRTKAQEQFDASQPPKFQATVDEATNGDADAMDIDSSTSEEALGNQSPASPQRNTAGTGPLPNGSTASSSAAAPPAPTGLNGMSGLGETLVAPQPVQDGIGLSSLSDALPNHSQASATHPTKPTTAQKLKFPHMPTPPPLPPKLDLSSADAYFQRFEMYIKDYQKACKAMTAHFIARDAELESDLDNGFCRNRGETTRKVGFMGYLARMHEDEEVLETWRVYQDAHIKALGRCEEVRNRTVRMYAGTG